MILEYANIGAAIVLMWRIAEMDNRSGALWALLTTLLCIAALFVLPWPMIRIGIATAIAFLAMFVCRLMSRP